MSSFLLCGRQFTCQELEKLALVYDFDIEKKTSFLVPLHVLLPVKPVWWHLHALLWSRPDYSWQIPPTGVSNDEGERGFCA